MGLIPSAFLLGSLSVWVLTCLYLNTFPTAVEGDLHCPHIPFWWFCGITRIPCLSLQWEQCQSALLVIRSWVPSNTFMRGWSIPAGTEWIMARAQFPSSPGALAVVTAASVLTQLWRVLTRISVKPFIPWNLLCREMFYRTAIISFLFS